MVHYFIGKYNTILRYMEVLDKIYNTDIQEYRSGNKKLGICMATFQRKNGKSPFYLKRSLTALMNQTATNWHLYLVGDKYDDNNELLNIIDFFPKDKITCINLDIAAERDYITNKSDLWKVGGSNAFNHSMDMALKDNCDYILHNDDDDPFHIKKLQCINYILSLYDDPFFIFHYSTFLTNTILPHEKINYLSKNNLFPRSCNVIHTSFCLNKSIASEFRYDGYEPGKTYYECGDVQLIEYILSICNSDISKYTIFIPLLLSNHDIEGEARSN